jgi:hypothetical protein
MIGYRYVSENDWLEVQEKGLLPRYIRDWEVKQYWANKELKGIWIWKRPLIGSEHVGAIIHQAIQKSSMKVYLLEVHYNKKWLLKHKDYVNTTFTHHGKLGNWTGWSNEARIDIVVKEIAKKNIRLLEEIDLTKILWEKRKLKKY